MLEVSVRSASGQVQVRLNGYDELTARAARAARNIAYGPAAHVTVFDLGSGTAYRITRSSTRKIPAFLQFRGLGPADG